MVCGGIDSKSALPDFGRVFLSPCNPNGHTPKLRRLTGTILTVNTVPMEITSTPLIRSPDGSLSPSEESAELLERTAVSTILLIMGSSADEAVRLDAARVALDVVGKRTKQIARAPQEKTEQPLIQLNFGSHLSTAIGGLVDVKNITESDVPSTKFTHNPNDAVDSDA